jgi:hypothetical protein
LLEISEPQVTNKDSFVWRGFLRGKKGKDLIFFLVSNFSIHPCNFIVP